MDEMKRYAVYYAPRAGAFASAAAAWLGWDAALGKVVGQADVPGLPLAVADLTAEPRKYGFHGTLRAPFRVAEGVGCDDLAGAVQKLAGGLAPVVGTGLRLESLDGFLVLVPEGCGPALQDLAAKVVSGTNGLRAPLMPYEIQKRRPESLTPRQRQLLEKWGYPYVMEEFQFHLTLTGQLSVDHAEATAAVLNAYLAPLLPQPFVIEDLCLFGEDWSGRFHLLHRYPLSG